MSAKITVALGILSATKTWPEKEIVSQFSSLIREINNFKKVNPTLTFVVKLYYPSSPRIHKDYSRSPFVPYEPIIHEELTSILNKIGTLSEFEDTQKLNDLCNRLILLFKELGTQHMRVHSNQPESDLI